MWKITVSDVFNLQTYLCCENDLLQLIRFLTKYHTCLYYIHIEKEEKSC